MASEKQHHANEQVLAIEQKVLNFIAQEQLIPAGGTVVVAVSGGADSLALLHFLHMNRQIWGVHVVGAHLDHCLREEASAGDRAAVMAYCERVGIPLLSVSRDVGQWAEAAGEGNIEAAARTVRYDFLLQAAAICGGGTIATAHHLDDQAETILMHVLRGSGLQGLCGIAANTSGVIRPFLTVTKAEILTYCAAYELDYCTDESNFDTEYLRNRIRHQLLPLLVQYNPKIVQNLANLGEICRRENDYLTAETEAAYAKIGAQVDGDCGTFLSEPFFALPLALQRRVLQYFFRMFQAKQDKISQKLLSFFMIELVRRLAVGQQRILPGDMLCCRAQDQFIITYLRREKESRPAPFVYPLADMQTLATLTFPGCDYAIQVQPVAPAKAAGATPDVMTIMGKDTLFVPWQLGLDMVIRNRRDGDMFSPRGMVGTMKLKKYFINEKIPAPHRDEIPLLARDREIFWVVPRRFGNIQRQTGKDIAEASAGGWYITVLERR